MIIFTWEPRSAGSLLPLKRCHPTFNHSSNKYILNSDYVPCLATGVNSIELHKIGSTLVPEYTQ